MLSGSWDPSSRPATAQGAKDDVKLLTSEMGQISIPYTEPSFQEFATSTFPRLQELPAEIRIKIWGFLANSHPTIIELQWLSTEFEQAYHEYGTPSILLICRESRFEGLKYYTSCHEQQDKQTTIRHIDSTSEWRRRVYVNFSVDLFRFQSPRQHRISSQIFRVAFPPPGRLNFDKNTIMRIQHLHYSVGPFLKPLKALLDVQSADSRISVVFEGNPKTILQTSSELLLGLHIRVLPIYIRKLSKAKFVYFASNGMVYPLTGDPLEVKKFLRNQTSF